MMTKINSRRLTYDAVLLALAIILAIVERWIPLDLFIPIPGIKLGLANVVTLFALISLKPFDAFMIFVLRCVLVGLVTGPISLFFSLSGGLCAFLLMWPLSKLHERVFSLMGISVAGAAAHNFGQMLFAVILLREPLLFLTYLPLLLLAGTISGTLTAIAALPLVRRFPRLIDERGILNSTIEPSQ